jgi:hypothetical protein
MDRNDWLTGKSTGNFWKTIDLGRAEISKRKLLIMPRILKNNQFELLRHARKTISFVSQQM